MDESCLNSMKGLITRDEYAVLKDALDSGDHYKWDSTMEELHNHYQHKKRQALINANIAQSILDYLNIQKKNGISYNRAWLDYIVGGDLRSNSNIVPVERYVEGMRERYRAKLYRLFDEYKPIRLGLQRSGNPEILRNIIKGVFKDSDANLSKSSQAIVDAIHQVTKELREDFNKAGGNIKYLEDFGLPISHYAPRLLKYGKTEWIRDVLANFIIRVPEDSKPIGAVDLLSKIYDHITSEKVIRGEEELTLDILKEFQGKRAIGNTHQKFRYLQPKNGDAWIGYMQKYGFESDPIQAIKDYIDHMATDIALMHKLGTNAWNTVDKITNVLRQQTGDKRIGRFAVASFDNMYSRNPAIPDKPAKILRGLRAFETITKLKLAGINTLTDPAYSATRAVYRGLKPSRVMKRYIKALFDEQDFKNAAKLGLISEYADSRMHAAYRYADIDGHGALEKLTDTAVRTYGINHATNAGKVAFSLEMSAVLADLVKIPYGSLPTPMARMLVQYGVTEAEWNILKKAITTIKGVEFLDTAHESLSKELGAKISGIIREETNLAIPEPGARVRAFATLGTQNNTLANEIMRMFSQFKTFGISTYLSTIGMAMDKGIPLKTRMIQLSLLIPLTSITGFFVLQLKDIAKNRTPREFNAKTALEGFLQGGAPGIVGDFVLENPNIYGGIPGRLVGPVVSDIQKAAVKVHKLATGTSKKKSAATVGLDVVTQITPFSTALNRTMLDSVYKIVDPDYWGKKARMREYLRKQHQNILIK